MSRITLNIPQEQELQRLIDYERSSCSVNDELVYRCAFLLRPDDELQIELLQSGALITKVERKRGTIVLISSDGYSYFMEQQRAQAEQRRVESRDVRLIGLSAFLGALGVVIGLILGKIL